MAGRVYQISIKPETAGERGLPKKPVPSARVTYQGLEGDFNRYRHEKKGGDSDQALLILPLETLQQLNDEGWPVAPGDLGENITTVGIPYDSFAPGKRYRMGDVEIEVSKPCTACTNVYLLPYVGEEKGPAFLRTLTHKEGGNLVNRRGWYAKVLEEGSAARDDAVEEAAS